MNYITLLWNLYKLKKNTEKTQDEIQALQHKKLYQLLHYAYDHSRYYHQVFEQAGIYKHTIDDTPISAFPIINKKILMEHFDELVTVDGVKQADLQKFDEQVEGNALYKGNYHVVHSSGSSGKPSYFMYDEDAWTQMLLAILRGALWDMQMMDILRLLWKIPRIVYIAACDGRYGGAMAVGSGISGVHARQLSLDVKQPLSEWIQQIKKFRPNMIIAYPSAIKILAELVEAGNVSLHMERIISCGEPLNQNLRKYLEQVFQCDIVNFYGASESLALGVELHPYEGMYLFDDMNYIEVENGKMYVTSLYNYAQPLIRYELSDRIIWDERKGRYPFHRIKNITGRHEDLMWFEDEQGRRDFLHPLSIEGFCMEGMLDYQFIQKDERSFELDIQVSSQEYKTTVLQEMTTAMKHMLKEKKLDYVQFIIMFVDEILPNPETGKKPLIVQQKGRRL